MKIILKNHTEEYAVREMVNSFYPKLKLEFVNEIPRNEDYILSEYVDNTKYVCRAEKDGTFEESIVPAVSKTIFF